MGTALVDAVHTLWTWLPTITTVARAITAVTGMVIAVHRAIRWWRTGR